MLNETSCTLLERLEWHKRKNLCQIYFTVRMAQLENLNFKLYLKLEAQVYVADCSVHFDPFQMVKDVIRLHQLDQSCNKNLKIKEMGVSKNWAGECIKLVSADATLVGQILNNVLREARALAVPGSCIEMQYSVIQKYQANKRNRKPDATNSDLVFLVSFNGKKSDIFQSQSILNGGNASEHSLSRRLGLVISRRACAQLNGHLDLELFRDQ